MIRRIRRVQIFALTLASAAACLLPNGAALAQSSDEVTYIAVVKGADVYVRCGAAESYYPYAKVNDGHLVKVTGEKFDWARIVTQGPAFEHAFGYIKYPKGDTARFRVASDGKSGVTLGKTDIIAPNLENNNSFKDSWKAIVRVEADQTLTIVKTTETDKDVIHSVLLPDSAQGWISKAYLEKASETQAAEYAASLIRKPAAKAADQPKMPSTVEPGSHVQPAKSPATGSPGTTAVPNLEDDDIAGSDSDTPAATATTPTITPTKPVEAPKPAEKKLPALSDLEAMLKVLQKEPVDTAEVGPLRSLYLELAERSASDARVVRAAKGRAEQLHVWAELQKRRGDLQAARERSKMTAAETDAVRKAIESSAEYIAVGRVAASTIYDGERLPKLLRLQDAATGRTIAYLQPDDRYELVNLIGTLVGIVGEKSYDETLRLNIVAPARIDMLTPDQDQQHAQHPSESTTQQNAAAKTE